MKNEKTNNKRSTFSSQRSNKNRIDKQMKKTFRLTLNTAFTIDFDTWGFTDAEQRGGLETKKLLINHYLEQNGVDDFELIETTHNSLFETIAAVVKAQNEQLRIESEE